MNKLIRATLIILTFTAFSSDAGLSSVPLPNDFKSTLQIADDYPLVQTGYSAQSVTDVAKFYLLKLGEPQLTRGNNTRMTLFYASGSDNIRISLYANDYKTEIAIMVTK
ncbi:hypothetical protein RC083_06675 [Pseudoalteromonas haloplanktis]|uniref:Uncharacterized protein n=1 Tax=Pseudoalteromonas haloplanktis TaxID=228 RepID=A0ABU1BCN1_PSEHA|nr:hypothetical protein [Pseudoalteromonas haloplanktis]MDQ9091274.1 hypothetical protein [Pseudoalteromonas haloplanktis]